MKILKFRKNVHHGRPGLVYRILSTDHGLVVRQQLADETEIDVQLPDLYRDCFPAYTKLFKPEFLERMVSNWLEVAKFLQEREVCRSLVVCNFEGSKTLFVATGSGEYELSFYRSKFSDERLLKYHSRRMPVSFSQLQSSFMEVRTFETRILQEDLDTSVERNELDYDSVNEAYELASLYSGRNILSFVRAYYDMRVLGVMHELRNLDVTSFLNLLVLEEVSGSNKLFARLYRYNATKTNFVKPPVLACLISELSTIEALNALKLKDNDSWDLQTTSELNQLFPEATDENEFRNIFRFHFKKSKLSPKQFAILEMPADDNLDIRTRNRIEEALKVAVDCSQEQLVEALKTSARVASVDDLIVLQEKIDLYAETLRFPDAMSLETENSSMVGVLDEWQNSMKRTRSLLDRVSPYAQTNEGIEKLHNLFDGLALDANENGDLYFDKSSFEEAHKSFEHSLVSMKF